MRRPRELPTGLARGPFLYGDLLGVGFSQERVRRRDISQLSWGIHVHQRAVPDTPETQILQRALILARALPECWLSHTTAAQLYGWPLPPELKQGGVVHLSQPAGTTRRIRRPAVTHHRVRIRTGDLTDWNGATITTPVRTWFDMAGLLSLDELVIIGDHLVRRPYPFYDGRREPYATRDQLNEVVESMSGSPGRKQALAAASLVRVGADSARETKLRLALLRAGLPEPSLQVPARPDSRNSPCADMGYPELKLAMEYDGGTHFTAQQARFDQRRNNTFVSAGWTVLHFNADDNAEGFTSAVKQVEEAISRLKRL
ncbi:DUF559 domain-containing protein [Nesterenkonia halotolerans]|uniref:DUF559 domain-containing protein n=1 Tax=Nesterenkonia halotolerans TaxID=225325 RepID=A0ABR9JA91_9MICC|nr:DUF559 domain-containing protein [Nesterenkonia halotolerans]MBE1515815.1 hypothetical protein [Nesterenkonia halotolerans]